MYLCTYPCIYLSLESSYVHMLFTHIYIYPRSYMKNMHSGEHGYPSVTYMKNMHFTAACICIKPSCGMKDWKYVYIYVNRWMYEYSRSCEMNGSTRLIKVPIYGLESAARCFAFAPVTLPKRLSYCYSYYIYCSYYYT